MSKHTEEEEKCVKIACQENNWPLSHLGVVQCQGFGCTSDIAYFDMLLYFFDKIKTKKVMIMKFGMQV